MNPLKKKPPFDIQYWREIEFPVTKEFVYLDNAAMSPLPTRVKDAVVNFHAARSNQGASFGEWWDEVEVVRSKVAALIGSDTNEIAFTQNTSMGINLFAQGLSLQKGDNLIISDLEFPSNVYPWMNLERNGVEVRFAKNINGQLPLSEIEKLIDENTKLISLSFVEAGNGYKNDLQAISKLCQIHNIYFVVDAIQGLGAQPIDVKELQIDFLVSGFFKWLFGPDGLGFVYVSEKMRDVIQTPFVSWTSMDDKFNYSTYRFQLSDSSRRFETGNLNFSAIRGINHGLDIINEVGIDLINKRVMELSSYVKEQIQSMNHVSLVSRFEEVNQSQILLVQCPDVDEVFENLKKNNIVVNKRNGLRISPHFYNTKEDIDCLLQTINS